MQQPLHAKVLAHHVGALESSKSAIKTFAPELSALMTIFRSTGPVISTRLSWMSSGMGATCHQPQLTVHTFFVACAWVGLHPPPVSGETS